MFLKIITYNKHHIINYCLLYFSHLIVVIFFILDNKYNNDILLTWLLVILVIVVIINIVHREVFEAFTIIGKCAIDLNTVRLKLKDSLDIIEFSEIHFIYGGYNGKSGGFFSGIFTGSNFKSGANNYLIFKKDTDTKIQIMINSKKEYKQLLNKLSELEASGIRIRKERYW